MFDMLINKYLSGMFNNHPMMKQFNQMLAGKTPEQQLQTIINFAKSNGINPDEKIFSGSGLRKLGIK